MILAIIIKTKSAETEPPFNEVKGEDLISCDEKTKSSRQSSLAFI
jgi:hypothetical protein